MKASKLFVEGNCNYIIIVEAKLNYIKGNSAPYFSITGEIWEATKDGNKKGRDCVSCGCLHDDIKKHFRHAYDDIIDLHLSDINGLPMYAVENGYYHYKQDSKKGFDYIRLPEGDINIPIRDKQDFINLVESLKPTYKQQAEDCIKKHNLVVTGDVWP